MGLASATEPDEPMPTTGPVPPAAARAHNLRLARPYVFCSRCGSFMRGTGRGNLLVPCRPREKDQQRAGRIARMERGLAPVGDEKLGECRSLRVDDPEVGWLRLTPAP